MQRKERKEPITDAREAWALEATAVELRKAPSTPCNPRSLHLARSEIIRQGHAADKYTRNDRPRMPWWRSW